MPTLSPFRALFIHGIGEQEPSFAHEARGRLREALRPKGFDLWPRSVHWAPLADAPQRRYLDAVQRAGAAGTPSQKLSIGTLSDAMMYITQPELRQQIFHQLDLHSWMPGYDASKAHRQPTYIFAHSLGGLIAADWLRARKEVTNVKLITFGCNIGLFSMGASFEPPFQVSKPGTWINLFHPRDMLGMPLRVDKALAHVQDVKVSFGWWKGWTGLAHLRYWNDRKLWSQTIPRLVAK